MLPRMRTRTGESANYTWAYLEESDVAGMSREEQDQPAAFALVQSRNLTSK